MGGFSDSSLKSGGRNGLMVPVARGGIVQNGLVLFLDGTNTSKMTLSGSRVDAWADVDGRTPGMVTSFAGTGFNPTYDASLFGGLGGLNCGNKFLETASALSSITHGGGWTTMAVMQRTSKGSFYMASDGNGAELINAGLQNRQGAGSRWVDSTGFPLNQTVIAGSMADATAIWSHLDGKRATITGSPYTPSLAFAKVQVGAMQPGNAGYSYMQAFLLWNRKLTDAELIQTVAALRSRFQAPAFPTRAYNVVVDGNSLAYGSGSTGNWAISDGIEGAGLSPIDYKVVAAPGNATYQLIGAAAAKVDALYDTGVAASRRVCVVWEITNDIAIAGVDNTQAYANIKQYCQNRKTAGWKVVVMTCLPRGNGANSNFETYRTAANASIRANAILEGWADAIADVAADPNIGVAGAAGAAGNTAATTYYADGVHLNSTGYAIAATYVTAAVNVAMGWQPTAISGLKLWLKPDTGLVAGTSWADQSGNGYSAVSGNTFPSKITAGRNGRDILRFNGTSDCLQVASFALTPYKTTYVAGNFDTTKDLFMEQGAGLATHKGFYIYGVGGFATNQTATDTAGGNNALYASVGTAADWLGGAAAYATVAYSGTTITLRKNGAAVTTNSSNINDIGNATITDTLNICSRAGSSVFTQGDLYEPLIYSGAHTFAQMVQVETYLKARWG